MPPFQVDIDLVLDYKHSFGRKICCFALQEDNYPSSVVVLDNLAVASEDNYSLVVVAFLAVD